MSAKHSLILMCIINFGTGQGMENALTLNSADDCKLDTHGRMAKFITTTNQKLHLIDYVNTVYHQGDESNCDQARRKSEALCISNNGEHWIEKAIWLLLPMPFLWQCTTLGRHDSQLFESRTNAVIRYIPTDLAAVTNDGSLLALTHKQEKNKLSIISLAEPYETENLNPLFWKDIANPLFWKDIANSIKRVAKNYLEHIKTDCLTKTLRLPEQASALTFGDHNKLLAIGFNSGAIGIINTKKKLSQPTLKKMYNSPVVDLKFINADEYLVSASSDKIFITKITSNTIVHILKGLEQPIKQLFVGISQSQNIIMALSTMDSNDRHSLAIWKKPEKSDIEINTFRSHMFHDTQHAKLTDIYVHSE